MRVPDDSHSDQSEARMNSRLTMSIALAALVAPTSTSAQMMQTCGEAEQVATERAGDSATRLAALTRLSACGPVGGRILAQELQGLKEIDDLQTVRTTYREVARIRDAAVLAVALDLVGDRTASLAARTAGLRILVEYHDPSRRTTFSQFMSPVKPDIIAVAQDGGKRQGEPLPVDWQGEARSVLARIIDDTNEGDEVRLAAKRAMMFLR